jgi:hypothetical protein
MTGAQSPLSITQAGLKPYSAFVAFRANPACDRFHKPDEPA